MGETPTKRYITICALLFTLMAPVSVFARFSQFVSISPDNPHHALLPKITAATATQDCITVQVPIIKGSRHYWLIVCKESLSPEKQNFRRMFHRPVEKRDDVIRITPLVTNAPNPEMSGSTTNVPSISVQLTLDLALRSYIYIDYPQEVMDGGYYYAVDIPAYVKRLMASAVQADQPETALFQRLTSAITNLCPTAEIKVDGPAFSAKHDTMVYTVHRISKTGEVYPTPSQDEGPGLRGFMLNVTLHDGEYGGAAGVPQTLQRPYYPTFMDAPSTDGGRKHYQVRFSYGARLNPDLKRVILESIPKTYFQPPPAGEER